MLAAVEKCLFGVNRNKIIVDIATGYDEGNYGDLLARYIVEQLSGKQIIKHTGNNSYHLCSVGSVLNRNKMCSNTVVWGSGFLTPQTARYKIVLTKIRQYLRGKVGQPVYLAVRGRKTREILLKAGYVCPEIYADPALIMPKLYFPKINTKFKLGVVLHWSQEKFASMFNNIEGVRVININRKYSEMNSFIDEVLSCNYILSSSLHGLIIANAYKIPCVRLKIEKAPIATSEEKDDFKFEDYVSGLNLCKEDKEKPDYVFHTLTLKPGVKRLDLMDLVKAQATNREFVINLTPLVQAFPFLASAYKGKEFHV